MTSLPDRLVPSELGDILLEKSVVRLQKENSRLRSEIARLKGQDVDPQMELELLKEQLAAMQRAAFGRSSERRASGSPKEESTDKKPQKGHGPRPQPNLPIEVVTHSLAEEERVCSSCGGRLEEWEAQAEESEEITVVGVEYKILRHRRQKYRCRCETQVVTAPGPVKLIPGGRYSIDFAVQVAQAKYLDHMPLERQARAMGRAGLDIGSQSCGIRSRRWRGLWSPRTRRCARGSWNPRWSTRTRAGGR